MGIAFFTNPNSEKCLQSVTQAAMIAYYPGSGTPVALNSVFGRMTDMQQQDKQLKGNVYAFGKDCY
jgi:hypothetical protein